MEDYRRLFLKQWLKQHRESASESDKKWTKNYNFARVK